MGGLLPECPRGRKRGQNGLVGLGDLDPRVRGGLEHGGRRRFVALVVLGVQLRRFHQVEGGAVCQSDGELQDRFAPAVPHNADRSAVCVVQGCDHGAPVLLGFAVQGVLVVVLVHIHLAHAVVQHGRLGVVAVAIPVVVVRLRGEHPALCERLATGVAVGSPRAFLDQCAVGVPGEGVGEVPSSVGVVVAVHARVGDARVGGRRHGGDADLRRRARGGRRG